MEAIHDIIIIGGGPAGYSAALYAARAGFDVTVFERMSAGGQMALTGDIENYPGFEDGIVGFELGMKMQAGAERFGAKTEYAEVISVDLEGKIKKVVASTGEFYSRVVIIATGADPRNLGLEGEEKLIGRGVHYCAHCDGRFYKGKTVAVVGGGNSAAADALYLSKLAEKVYLIHRRDTLRATKIYHEPLMRADNVEILWNSKVESFLLDGGFSGVVVKDLKSGERKDINVNGLFVSIGRRPLTSLFAGQVSLDEFGYLVADESTRTDIEGVYAVGDVRTKALRQIVTAVSDGATAIHYAEEYLASF